MKSYLATALVLSLASLGCERNSNVNRSTEAVASNEPETVAVSKELNPVFEAEVFFESRSPEKGTVRLTASLVSTYKSEVSEESDRNAPTRSTRFESTGSEMEFTLQDGSVCKMKPTFIGHHDGHDEWSVELDYGATVASDGTRRQGISKTILFDGESPEEVIKDEQHSILLRPRTKTESN